MNFSVSHTTQYIYSDPVQLCHNQACLLPRETPAQTCRFSRLRIVPEPVDTHDFIDYFGNRLTHFSIQKPHEKLTVTVTSEVSIHSNRGLYDAANRQPWETVRDFLARTRGAQMLDVLPCCYNSPQVKTSAKLQEYAQSSFPPGRPLAEAVHELMERIYREFTYDPGFTTISTPLEKVIETRRGVCQDFAHLAIGCLRSLGLAARYISGYIETVPPPGQERLVGADASHAWFAVFSPEAGWVAFDPTNNQMPTEQHITVAWGRDFSDVSPLKGVALGGGHHRVIVSVDVARQPENEIPAP